MKQLILQLTLRNFFHQKESGQKDLHGGGVFVAIYLKV